MAKYVGKPLLIDNNGTSKLQKGQLGEQLVAHSLTQVLDSESIVVGFPQIGKYDPDFLILSPRFGIRIVEVKNFSLDAIAIAHTNGLIVFKNDSNHNPMQQAKTHSENILHLLERELPEHFKGKAPIGYLVIHAGFTRHEFEKKFPHFIDANDFWKHHAALDEIISGFEGRLMNSTKFKRSCPNDSIEKILDLVKYREQTASESSILKLEMETKIQELDQKISKIQAFEKTSVEKPQTPITSSNDITTAKKRKSSYFIEIFLLLFTILIGVTWVNLNSTNSDLSTVQIGEIESFLNQDVTVYGKVERFYFDDKSKTKFLTISDISGEIDAIIFEKTVVPYIYEGKRYKLLGKVQNFDGEYQLVVNNIEPN
jgi:hypothetical protein